jgi:hypothetical protein
MAPGAVNADVAGLDLSKIAIGDTYPRSRTWG